MTTGDNGPLFEYVHVIETCTCQSYCTAHVLPTLVIPYNHSYYTHSSCPIILQLSMYDYSSLLYPLTRIHIMYLSINHTLFLSTIINIIHLHGSHYLSS